MFLLPFEDANNDNYNNTRIRRYLLLNFALPHFVGLIHPLFPVLLPLLRTPPLRRRRLLRPAFLLREERVKVDRRLHFWHGHRGGEHRRGRLEAAVTHRWFDGLPLGRLPLGRSGASESLAASLADTG